MMKSRKVRRREAWRLIGLIGAVVAGLLILEGVYLMSFDPNIITAWSAILAAGAAIAAVGVAWRALRAENDRSRFSLGVELIVKLDERFESKELCCARRAAAKALGDENEGKNYADADEVLNFFELVGMLHSREVLDDEMVWAMFSNSLLHYYALAKEYILTVQQSDTTICQHLCELHKLIVEIDKNKRKCSEFDVEPSKESLKQFLISDH